MRAEQLAVASLAATAVALAALPWAPWRPRGAAQWAAAGLAWVAWQRLLASGFRTWTVGRVGRVAAPPSHAGQVFVVTGAGVGGIGYWTAAALLARGATVVVTARSAAAAKDAAARLRGELAGPPPAGAAAHGMALQLSDPRSVRAFAAELKAFLAGRPLDGLVNNAGAMQPSPTWVACAGDGTDGTAAKVEVNIATNFLGPHYLTQLLLPLMPSGAPRRARVVFVASQAHRKVPDLAGFWDRSTAGFATVAGTPFTFGQQFEQYGLSKLGNMADAVGFSAGPAATAPLAVSLHPGVAWGTNVVNDLPPAKFLASIGLKQVVIGLMMLFMRSPQEAADTSVFCATAPDAALRAGGYYVDGADATSSQRQGPAKDDAALRRLFDWGNLWTAKWAAA